jgi:hypothetical protein
MAQALSFEELKDLGAGRLAPDPVRRLYNQAFLEFGPQYLWSRRPSEHPTLGQALVIAENLRREGDMRCRSLAAELEQACRAALQLAA